MTSYQRLKNKLAEKDREIGKLQDNIRILIRDGTDLEKLFIKTKWNHYFDAEESILFGNKEV